MSKIRLNIKPRFDSRFYETQIKNPKAPNPKAPNPKSQFPNKSQIQMFKIQNFVPITDPTFCHPVRIPSTAYWK
jgi:hypothetical protein